MLQEIFINIENYKINLYNCKNNHTRNNISFEEFENIEKIDLSKIKCDNCKLKNMSNSYNNDFYMCNTCNVKLCLICKSYHNREHIFIHYKDKNYKCRIHNEKFIKYCKECKNNICIVCEKSHKNHNIINYKKYLFNKEQILKENEELTEIINQFKII